MAPGAHPTSALVLISWIGSIPGLTSQMVSTQLPAPQNWPKLPSGVGQFITVSAIGGRPSYSQEPIAEPVMQVKCWATKVGSAKPPWFAANALCETIRYATYDRRPGVFGRALIIQQGGVTYNPATVMGTCMHTEPRQIFSDQRNYACYSFDLELCWKEVNVLVG